MKLPGLVLLPIIALVLSLGMLGYNLSTTNTSTGTLKTSTNTMIVGKVDVPDINNKVIQSPSHTADLVATMDKTLDKKAIKQLVLTPGNTVFLVGAIGGEHALLGQEILQKAKTNSVIYLVLNSPGGSVLDGNMIVSAIQASPVPVITIDLQLAASMAAIIFEYGKERYMVDRSILMFHEAAGGVSGSFNQIHSRFKLFNGIVNKIDAEIAQRVGMKYEDFRSKLSNELWMDAEDALATKFSDGYVNLNLTAFGANAAPEDRLKMQQAIQTNFLESEYGNFSH